MGQQIFVFISLLLYGHCIAGPVRDESVMDTTPSDSVCTVKNTTYSRGEEIPNVAPCETCICEPPNINCSMIKCQPNNGCKIIQQPNKCCPDYKCDCEYGGKTYNNGEKLDNPSNPCQVCYCRGGEIMCNSITCYRRDDCEPQHVEGQCCPKYGHCPTKNSSSVIAVPGDPSILSTKREMQPWLLTKPMNVETKESHKYPQTIKIVEILPTQNPPKSGEVSLVPRIITNGSPQDFKMSSSYQPVTESCAEGCSNSSSDETAETSASPTVIDNGDSGEPDSETVTKLWAHFVDSTTNDDELAALSNGVTEGSGYDILTGGTFFPIITKDEDDSSEESKEETNNSTDTTTYKVLTSANSVEANDTEPRKSADLKQEFTELGADSSNVITESSWSTIPSIPSSDVTNGEIMVTRHGLTIPPVLKLNQVDHLTLPNSGDESESRSVVQVGVYDPTKPDEQSNLVTVIKNEERSMGSTVSSVETTQLLLTPEDLKTLAEIIIKEKIKPPKEELRLGSDSTTPLSLEISEPTTIEEVDSTNKSEYRNDMTEIPLKKTVEETTTVHYVGSSSISPMLHELTKEEEKSQKSVATTEPSVAETLIPESGNILEGHKDVEWVGENNPSNQSEIVDNDVDKTTTTVADTTTTDSVKFTTAGQTDSTVSSTDATTRGALRQMENLLTTQSEWTDRIKTGSVRTKPTHSAMLDENDRIIVANFFRKALNFH